MPGEGSVHARKVQAGERERATVRRLAFEVQVPCVRSRNNLHALYARLKLAESVDLERPLIRRNPDLARKPDDPVRRVELLEGHAPTPIRADEAGIGYERVHRVAQRDRLVAIDVERVVGL